MLESANICSLHLTDTPPSVWLYCPVSLQELRVLFSNWVRGLNWFNGGRDGASAAQQIKGDLMKLPLTVVVTSFNQIPRFTNNSWDPLVGCSSHDLFLMLLIFLYCYLKQQLLQTELKRNITAHQTSAAVGRTASREQSRAAAAILGGSPPCCHS